jgi:excisionase family DNA binding protein
LAPFCLGEAPIEPQTDPTPGGSPRSGAARRRKSPEPRNATRALLTVRQVASALVTSTATVYLLCDRGELRHLRVCNAIRIAPEDLAAFIQRHKARR